MSRSYQYINFDGRREGEKAPYVVLNGRELVARLESLSPAALQGYGYWGVPSGTTSTPFEQVVFSVIAAQKRERKTGPMRKSLELPPELGLTSSK
jgi:hypothetical protein